MKNGLKALVNMPQEIFLNLFEAFLFTLLYFSAVKRRVHLDTKNHNFNIVCPRIFSLGERPYMTSDGRGEGGFSQI